MGICVPVKDEHTGHALVGGGAERRGVLHGRPESVSAHPRDRRQPQPGKITRKGGRRPSRVTRSALARDLDLWVPITSSMSCDQAVFVDQAADVSVSSDAVLVEVDRLG
jgi:hypothetical protein